MKYLILMPLLAVLCFYGCKDEGICSSGCGECISIDVPFYANVDCGYIYPADSTGLGEDLVVTVTGIEDYRDYGVGCQSSTGGRADIYIELQHGELSVVDTFSWRGCESEYIPEVGNGNIPWTSIGDYELWMLKMYPLSGTLDAPPSDMGDYEILMTITR